jgi:hypothetical protein
MAVLRTSSSFGRDIPDLTVGAIEWRRFAPDPVAILDSVETLTLPSPNGREVRAPDLTPLRRRRALIHPLTRMVLNVTYRNYTT